MLREAAVLDKIIYHPDVEVSTQDITDNASFTPDGAGRMRFCSVVANTLFGTEPLRDILRAPCSRSQGEVLRQRRHWRS